MLAKRFPVLIIDECQDLSEDQITIIEHLRSAGSVIHFVGDMNQAIYEFREVKPEVLLNYVKHNQVLNFYLTQNFRSNQFIANTSNLLISNTHTVSTNLPSITEHPCILWQYDSSTFAFLPSAFEKLLLQHSLDFKKSAIISRGKTVLTPLRIQYDKSKFDKVELFALALFCWNKADRTTEDLKNALYYMGRCLYLIGYEGSPNFQNQYCPDCFSSVEWRLQLKRVVECASVLYPFTKDGADILWSKWVSTLKRFLEVNWEELSKSPKQFSDICSKLRAPNKRGNSPVHDICSNPEIRNVLRTTTIHSVKGETLEAALIVSSFDKKSKGGHHSHWFNEGDKYEEEHTRFAYVAFSRPKHLLVLATPKLSASDLSRLEKLGFKSTAF